MRRISIIIPILNEEEYIGRVIENILKNSSAENIKEIIVVDGGSTDASIDIVSQFQNIKFLNSSRGRAKQLNYGAQMAKGEILYFLHGDSFPPKNFDKKILKKIDQNCVGCFRLKFERPSHYLLKISQWTTRLNFSLFRGGDQSLFITQKSFESLGGFNEEYIVYEDVEFINRVYKKYNFKIIRDYVVTSERRFTTNGIWKLHFNFLMIHVKHWLGANHKELYSYYVKNIKG